MSLTALRANYFGDKNPSLLSGEFEDRMKRINTFSWQPQIAMPARRILDGKYSSMSPERALCSHPKLINASNVVPIAPISIAWHSLRATVRVVISPLSLLVSTYQQCRYGNYEGEDGVKRNFVWQNCNEIGWEIMDLFWSIVAIFISLVNLFYSNLIPTDCMEKYYLQRFVDQANSARYVEET